MWRLGVQPCKNGRRVHILIIGLMPETLKKRSSANQFDTPGLERSSVWSASHTGARSPPSAASAGLRSWQPVQTLGLARFGYSRSIASEIVSHLRPGRYPAVGNHRPLPRPIRWL